MSVLQLRAFTVMNLCLSVNSEKKYLWNSFFICGCLLLEANSRCWSTPIKLVKPWDLKSANAWYPFSSMAFEAWSGSVLSCVVSAYFDDMTINTTSATLPTSKTEYTSFLSISRNISLCLLDAIFAEDPAFGQTKAWNWLSRSHLDSASIPCLFFREGFCSKSI